MQVNEHDISPETALVITDVNEVFTDHIELLQAVWMLRVGDVPYVLREEPMSP